MQIVFGMKRPKSFIENSILRQSKEYQDLRRTLPPPTTPEVLASNRAILQEARDKILKVHPRWPEVEQERKEDAIREANGEFERRPPKPPMPKPLPAIIRKPTWPRKTEFVPPTQEEIEANDRICEAAYQYVHALSQGKIQPR